MLDTSKMDMRQKVLLVITLSGIFVFVTVPFKIASIIPGFTEIRPASCLNMIFGLVFGVYGAIGCAVGNLISDILGGTFRISSWAGSVANFLGTYLAYILWYRLVKEPPRIRNITEVGAYAAVTMAAAVVVASIITGAVWISYPDMDIQAVFIQIVVNMVAFPVILGLPLLIIAENVYGLTDSVPEQYREK